MGLHRANRLKEVIKEEISDIIRKELKDPRIGELTTITGVEVANDLRHAKVYASIYGDEEKQQETFKGLKSASGFIRTELGKRIRLRHTPEIVFYHDTSIAHGARIFELIKQVKEERKEDHDSETDKE